MQQEMLFSLCEAVMFHVSEDILEWNITKESFLTIDVLVFFWQYS
jgi:hypothetical protein